MATLGEPFSVNSMIAEFEKETYFLTYHGERDPSISVNCNILICLLRNPGRASHAEQIMKCVRFLSRNWQSGNVLDKWACIISISLLALLIGLTEYLEPISGDAMCSGLDSLS